MSSSAFNSTTANRPACVVVSTSIMARSAAENAGTCEYWNDASSRSSTTLTSPTSAPDVSPPTDVGAVHKDDGCRANAARVRQTQTGPYLRALALQHQRRKPPPLYCETIPECRPTSS